MKNYQITVDFDPESKPVFFEMLSPGALFYIRGDPTKDTHFKLPEKWQSGSCNAINLSNNYNKADIYEKVICIQINSLTIKSQER